MALHADAGKRHAGGAQLADVLHVVVEPVAGGDVVIVDEELGVGVALLHPERHLPDEIDAEALLVVARSTLMLTNSSFITAAVPSSSNDSCAITWHQWQAGEAAQGRIGRSEGEHAELP